MPEQRNAGPDGFWTESDDSHTTQQIDLEVGRGSSLNLNADVSEAPETARSPDTSGIPIQQESPGSAPGYSEKSSGRKIFNRNPVEVEFEEGPPRHRNPSLDAFKAIFAEAQQIEHQISAAEERLEQDVEPLRIRQVLLAFQASKLIADDRDLANLVDSLLLEAGIKSHGNEKIPCSRLVRAIVLQNESKGTPQYKRKKQRATPYASAIDYGIQKGMTAEDFEKEVRHRPTQGESHGIERLADLGVELRGGKVAERVDPPADRPFRVEGDFTGIEPGDHLMLIRVEGETASGVLLTVPENVFRRVLVAHNKSHPPDSPG